MVAFVLLRNSRFNFHCYTQREATPTQKSARKWGCDLSRLFARKMTKGIHSCKLASPNRQIPPGGETFHVQLFFPCIYTNMYLYGWVPLMIVAFCTPISGGRCSEKPVFSSGESWMRKKKKKHKVNTLPKTHPHSSPGRLRTLLYLVVRTPTVLPAFTWSHEWSAYQQS